MSPTILVAGATGNTGPSVVETLSKLLKQSTLSGYRILATTRSRKGDVAQRLAKLPGVEIVELSWTEITAAWLREQHVVRVFIASYASPSQFAEESTFWNATLEAGIDYAVRISTTTYNVRPDCKAYYPRNHWAIEGLLSSPEFSALKWTSLQPNVFFPAFMGSAVELVKNHRNGGQQRTLSLMLAEDALVGVIDASDVGAFAGRLLLEENVSKHNKAKYVLNGPEDLTGAKLVKLVQEYTKVPIEEVKFKDMSGVDYLVSVITNESRNVIGSLRHSQDLAWEGQASASTTSQVVLDLSPPVVTPAEAFGALLD